MKRLIGAVFLTFLTTSQSFALSCMADSIEGSYISHRDAKERFILVMGRLTDKRNVVLGPEIEGGMDARSENFTATLVGHQASRAGFDRPIETTVAVSVECGGPWCGSVAVDTRMITFLEITPYGHELAVGPCGGNVFYNPTKDQNRRVLQCLRGGVCQPEFR
ncbi:hypothetical protein [Profundibacter sp.]